MNVDKVMPIYNRIQYWHKYKPYMRKSIEKYPVAEWEIEDFYSRCWEHIFSKPIKVIEYIRAYICSAIRRQAKLYFEREHVNEIPNSDLVKQTLNKRDNKLNITLNDFVEAKFINNIINRLQANQQTVIRMYFGIPPYNKTQLKDIAKLFNVSSNRVANIRNQALNNLRKILKGKHIYNMEDFINE